MTRWIATEASPAGLDVLGRMPIPLRRPFQAGLEPVLAQQRDSGQPPLRSHFLQGGDWYTRFDQLTGLAEQDLPAMLVTPAQTDILQAGLLAHYSPPGAPLPPPAGAHPACVQAGLFDPQGVFQVFASVVFVFLVDEARLAGRPAPRAWADLLAPIWQDDIVFGGWRPNDSVPYQDYNSYLLLALAGECGDDGLRALAGNVRRLQHNIRTATQLGSNSREVGAIAILPWMQAELCPRRQRTRVVWPADGALAMPLAYLLRPHAHTRLAPVVDYLHGEALARMLTRNCYPPTQAWPWATLPAQARLKWPGWDTMRAADAPARAQHAAQVFFAALDQQQQERMRQCS